MTDSSRVDASPATEPVSTVMGILRPIVLRPVLFMLCTIGASLGLTGASYLLTPKYRVQAVLFPSDSGSAGSSVRALGDLGGLAALAGVNIGGGQDSTVESVAMLKSKLLIRQFIVERDLLPVLFAKKWDSAAKRWAVEPADIPSVEDGVKLFDRRVRRVGEDRKTGLVTLSVEWTDRAVAEQWANELVLRLNKEMRDRAIRESDASLQQLQVQYAAAEIQPLQQSVAELIEAQVKRKTFAQVRRDYALRVVDPAFRPDADDYFFPKRPVFALAGALFGALLGYALALMALRSSKSRIAK